MVHNWEHQRMMYIKMVLVMVMVTVLDINTNLSGKWYGYMVTRHALHGCPMSMKDVQKKKG